MDFNKAKIPILAFSTGLCIPSRRNDMERRAFMTAAAGLVATAGCTTRAVKSPGTTTSTNTHDNQKTTSPTTTRDNWATTDTTAACPSFVGNADRTVCSDNPGDAEVYLTRSDERFVDYGGNDTVETTRFTLVNESDRTFTIDVNDWAVKRQTDDGWHHVAPDDHTDALTEVSASGRHEWLLGTESHSAPMSEDSQSIVAELASAGRHAFVVHGSLGDEHIECVARFKYLLAVPGE